MLRDSPGIATPLVVYFATGTIHRPAGSSRWPGFDKALDAFAARNYPTKLPTSRCVHTG